MIDIFCHILPPPYFDALQRVAPDPAALKRWLELPMLHDLSMRLELMDMFPGYRQVLNLSSPPIEAFGDPALSLQMARLANDSMADLRVAHPDRFPAWVAALPLQSPDDARLELERAIANGARGAQVYTNVNGVPLDAAELEGVFEMLEGADLPVWLHPARGPGVSDYATESRSRYEIWWAFGWPYETSAALARLLFSGTLDRYPRLKVITHHLGGMIPFFEGRIRHGWDQMGSRTSDEDLASVRDRLDHPPIEAFRRLYGDTAVSGSAIALRCGLEFFGVDHVLFGTDFPFDEESGVAYIRETLEGIAGLDLHPAERSALLEENAARLLHLDAD